MNEIKNGKKFKGKSFVHQVERLFGIKVKCFSENNKATIWHPKHYISNKIVFIKTTDLHNSYATS